MKNIEELKLYIEKIRANLQSLISSKDDLLDIEIINISRKLDMAINNYHTLTRCWNERYKETSYGHNGDYELHDKNRSVVNK